MFYHTRNYYPREIYFLVSEKPLYRTPCNGFKVLASLVLQNSYSASGITVFPTPESKFLVDSNF